jgi:hypothetical protein
MRTQAAHALWSRLAWFVGLWLAGVGTVGLVGLIIRAWLR